MGKQKVQQHVRPDILENRELLGQDCDDTHGEGGMTYDQTDIYSIPIAVDV
jgi:hypothetical protein